MTTAELELFIHKKRQTTRKLENSDVIQFNGSGSSSVVIELKTCRMRILHLFPLNCFEVGVHDHFDHFSGLSC